MKTIKIGSLKIFLNILVTILFLSSLCAQPGNSPKAEVSIEKTQIDIQAAVISGNLEIVKQHIDAGTDINIKDQMSGSTPLITASTFGKTDIAKVLIDANAELDIKNNEGSTALHAAAFFGRVEIVQMLIEAGADKSLKNKHNATPLQSVTVPFSEIKPIYEMISKQLEPLGLQLDLKELEINRPMIAILLRE